MPYHQRVVLAGQALAHGGRLVWALLRLRIGRYAVEGPSMRPTLLDGDRVLVLHGFYRLVAPRRGDLVLARPAALRGRLVIKRIAAVSGLSTERQYVVLGDNPTSSTDSRHFGALQREELAGRVWLRYWPDARRGRITHPTRSEAVAPHRRRA